MALAATQVADPIPKAQGGAAYTYPTGIQSSWQTVCTAPDTAESGDAVSGGKVIKPSAITRDDQALWRPQGKCTSVGVALKYNSDVGTPTSPVVRVFGKDSNGLWHVLQDTSGSTEVTLTVATTTDTVQSTAYKITTPKFFDLDGSEEIIVAVQTAFSAVSGTVNDSQILVKGL